MTSSNETFVKSRVFTALAIVIAIVAFAAIGILFTQVQALDSEFGTIKRDRAHYENQNQNLLATRASLVGTVTALEHQQSSAQEKLTEVSADLAAKKTDLDLASKRTKDAEERAAELQERADVASKLIADADLLKSSISELRMTKSGLESEIRKLTANEVLLAEANSRLDGEKKHRTEKVSELEIKQKSLELERNSLETDVEKLRSDQQRLLIATSSKEVELADLEQKLGTIKEDLSKLDGGRKAAESAAENAKSRLSDLKNAILEEQKARDKLSADLGQMTAKEASLREQVNSLEGRKSDLDAIYGATIVEHDKAILERDEAIAERNSALAMRDDADKKRMEIIDLRNAEDIKLEGLLTQKSRAQSDLATAEESLRQVQDSARAALRELQVMKDKITSSRSEFLVAEDAGKARIIILNKKIEELQGQQTKLQQEDAEAAAKLDQVRSNLDRERASLQQVAGFKGALQAQKGDLQAQLEDLLGKNEDAQQKRDQVLDGIGKAEDTRDELAKELQNLEAAKEALRVEAQKVAVSNIAPNPVAVQSAPEASAIENSVLGEPVK